MAIVPVFNELFLQTNMLWYPLSWFEPRLNPVKGYGKCQRPEYLGSCSSGGSGARCIAGIYELVRHDMKPGLISELEYVAQQGLPSRMDMDYPKPLGMWQCEFGPTQSGIIIIIVGAEFVLQSQFSFSFSFFDFSPRESGGEREAQGNLNARRMERDMSV